MCCEATSKQCRSNTASSSTSVLSTFLLLTQKRLQIWTSTDDGESYIMRFGASSRPSLVLGAIALHTDPDASIRVVQLN